MIVASIFATAEKAAAAVRAKYAVGGPPIDVHALAWDMKVDRIVVKAIIGDGRLEERGGSRVIIVQQHAGVARQRFTIAHELGHIWLRGQARRSALDDHGRDEQFCNAFAAALLLPRQWVTEQARIYEPSLEALQRIAKDADVSLASCLLGMRRFPNWRLTLLSWRWDEGAWRLSSVTGLPPQLRSANAVVTVDKTRQALNLVARLSEQPVGGSLWLGVGDRVALFPAEIVVRRSSAVAFVDLTQAEVAQSMRAQWAPAPHETSGRRCGD